MRHMDRRQRRSLQKHESPVSNCDPYELRCDVTTVYDVDVAGRRPHDVLGRITPTDYEYCSRILKVSVAAENKMIVLQFLAKYVLKCATHMI